MAGASPNTTPVRTEIPAVNNRTRGSKLRSNNALPKNRRPERPQRRAPPVRDEQTRGAADDREQHALGEQLANEPRPARAHRRANADFFFSRRRLREQQIRETHARA